MLIIGFAWTGPVLHILYFYVEKFGNFLGTNVDEERSDDQEYDTSKSTEM